MDGLDTSNHEGTNFLGYYFIWQTLWTVKGKSVKNYHKFWVLIKSDFMTPFLNEGKFTKYTYGSK